MQQFTPDQPLGLLNAFRVQYHHFVVRVTAAITENADSVVLSRIGDDLDQYLQLLNEVCTFDLISNNV